VPAGAGRAGGRRERGPDPRSLPGDERSLEVQLSTSRFEAGIFWSLLAVVLLSPWPLGSDRPLPASLLAAATGALVLAWGVGALFARTRPAHAAGPLLAAAALFACTVAWAVAQASSLTPAVLHHPYWAEANAVLTVPAPGAISVDPEATWTRLQGLLAYGGVFWLAFQLGSRRGRARQALLAVAAAGLLYAAYGLYQDFVRAGPVTGTFVSRNSYATYAGMTLVCALGLALRRFAGHARADRAVGQALVRMLARLDLATTTALLSSVACGTALLLTQSRGAFSAVALAVVLYLWLLRSAAILRSRGSYGVFAAVVLAAAVSLAGYSGAATIERLEQPGPSLDSRLAYFQATWAAIGDRPLLGTGYGTYPEAFLAYNGPATGTYYLDKAHDTYLQLAFELGWPAALALFACLGCLNLRCWQGLRGGGRGRVYAATVLACSTLVGAHALVDFSMEMPANAATYALLLGIGCARSRGHGRGRAEDQPAAAGGPLTSPR
jgi:O-antigen ligase